MATVAAQTVTQSGITPTYNAASGGGDKCPAEDDVMLVVKNGSGGSINLTIVTPGTVSGNAIADKVIAVPSSGERHIKLSKSLYADNTGLASLTWSSATSVTFAVIRVSD